MKRMKGTIALVLALGMLTSCQKADTGKKTTTKTVETTEGATQKETETVPQTTEKEQDTESSRVLSLTKEMVKSAGRNLFSDQALWLINSGSYVEFSFTGKSLSLDLIGDSRTISGGKDARNRIRISVDGKEVTDFQMKQAMMSVDVFQGEEDREVIVRIEKLSEAPQSVFGIKDVVVRGKDPVPTENKELFIEFVGDSITCGYGVDDEDKDHHFSTATEDATKTYAVKTAEKLEADYALLSMSGFGIISGYSGDGQTKQAEQIVPPAYGFLGYTYGTFMKGDKAQSIPWDFSRLPDVVVINLGTNDNSYCKNYADRKAEFTEAYQAFIKQVRSCNPEAKIVCALGIMGQDLYPQILEAVEAVKKETGDEKLFTFRFSMQDTIANGLAADWHPTERSHEKAAQELAAFLKEIL